VGYRESLFIIHTLWVMGHCDCIIKLGDISVTMYGRLYMAVVKSCYPVTMKAWQPDIDINLGKQKKEKKNWNFTDKLKIAHHECK
jgi:hypothetical protein